MKKIMFATIVAVAAISGFIGYSNHLLNQRPNALTLANIEALTDCQEINGEWYVVDEIPCSSSANEIRVDYSYVNCTDCESQKGKATDENGKCTSIRPMGI